MTRKRIITKSRVKRPYKYYESALQRDVWGEHVGFVTTKSVGEELGRVEKLIKTKSGTHFTSLMKKKITPSDIKRGYVEY